MPQRGFVWLYWLYWLLSVLAMALMDHMEFGINVNHLLYNTLIIYNRRKDVACSISWQLFRSSIYIDWHPAGFNVPDRT